MTRATHFEKQTLRIDVKIGMVRAACWIAPEFWAEEVPTLNNYFNGPTPSINCGKSNLYLTKQRRPLHPFRGQLLFEESVSIVK